MPRGSIALFESLPNKKISVLFAFELSKTQTNSYRFCTGLTFGILARCAFGIKIDTLCDLDDVATHLSTLIYTDAKQTPSFLLPGNLTSIDVVTKLKTSNRNVQSNRLETKSRRISSPKLMVKYDRT